MRAVVVVVGQAKAEKRRRDRRLSTPFPFLVCRRLSHFVYPRPSLFLAPLHPIPFPSPSSPFFIVRPPAPAFCGRCASSEMILKLINRKVEERMTAADSLKHGFLAHVRPLENF